MARQRGNSPSTRRLVRHAETGWPPQSGYSHTLQMNTMMYLIGGRRMAMGNAVTYARSEEPTALEHAADCTRTATISPTSSGPASDGNRPVPRLPSIAAIPLICPTTPSTRVPWPHGSATARCTRVTRYHCLLPSQISALFPRSSGGGKAAHAVARSAVFTSRHDSEGENPEALALEGPRACVQWHAPMKHAPRRMRNQLRRRPSCARPQRDECGHIDAQAVGR